jgi:hypothetical protein
MFVEILNATGKNSIVGVIYRHPTGNSIDFLETYLKPLVHDKLSKEIINRRCILQVTLIMISPISTVRKQYLIFLIS